MLHSLPNCTGMAKRREEMEKIVLLWTLYKEEAMDGGGVGVCVCVWRGGY